MAEDISPKVSVILRKKGVDAISAHEAGMLESSHEEQLAFAAADRVMATRNRDYFFTLTVQFFHDLKPHKGLIIVPRTIPGSEFNKSATLLAHFSKNIPKGMQAYTIEFLPSK